MKSSKTYKESLFELFTSFVKETIRDEKFYSNIGKVTAVDKVEKTCTVEVTDGPTITDVRLQQVSSSTGLLIVPSINSIVIVSWSDKTTAYLSMFSQTDEIVYQNGTNGGLIIINNQVTKLNDLISSVNAMYSEFKAHTHNVTAVGSPTGPVIPVPTEPDASNFNGTDFENDKFKH